ncbi:hypothetical protein MUP07_00650 [Candidatus Bathyarchaeota archaeon]|nr:hypothetical protein [Candidatus Bathyarchaeota archaeon]
MKRQTKALLATLPLFAFFTVALVWMYDFWGFCWLCPTTTYFERMQWSTVTLIGILLSLVVLWEQHYGLLDWLSANAPIAQSKLDEFQNKTREA